MNKNDVSIIVPVYNASAYLRDCLDSIRYQTMKEWTCFLVNDGSTDDSQSIIDEYCQMDGRFVGMNKVNEGSPAKTVRYAFPSISSEFVVSLGDDDLISEDYVEKLIQRQCDTDADMVIPYMLCFKGEINSVLWIKPDEPFDNNQVLDGREACMLTIPDWKIGMNGIMIRKRIMESTPIGKWSYSDELNKREMLIACRCVSFTDAKYYYRFNPTGITKSISPRMFEKSIIEAQLVRFAKKYFPEDKTLIAKLAQKHFSGLQSNIVTFEANKEMFSAEDCERIQMVLIESYRNSDIHEIMKRSIKWGIAVGVLRRFSWYQRLVASHFKK